MPWIKNHRYYKDPARPTLHPQNSFFASILKGAGVCLKAGLISMLGLIILAGAYVGFSYFVKDVPHIRLPNGYRVSPVFYDSHNIHVYDPEGYEIVPANVAAIMWCGDVIYGVRSRDPFSLFWNPSKHNVPSSFLYDGKEKKLYQADIDVDLEPERRQRLIPEPKEEYQRYKTYADLLWLKQVHELSEMPKCPAREPYVLKNPTFFNTP